MVVVVEVCFLLRGVAKSGGENWSPLFRVRGAAGEGEGEGHQGSFSPDDTLSWVPPTPAGGLLLVVFSTTVSPCFWGFTLRVWSEDPEKKTGNLAKVVITYPKYYDYGHFMIMIMPTWRSLEDLTMVTMFHSMIIMFHAMNIV